MSKIKKPCMKKGKQQKTISGSFSRTENKVSATPP